MDKNLLFALDIGTRSVVGLIGEQTADGIRLVAADRQEHHTRSMLDGQIHDVPEVAEVLAAVKNRLEQTAGPLTAAAVAAAGRALCTVKAAAEIEAAGNDALTATTEHTLELAAVQAAQKQLTEASPAGNPADYYCVGYSVMNFTLDDTRLKTLVGQFGKKAGIELIATFLPRQVIDSLQSALETAGLKMASLTLEPIAAINFLIPPTMRHLNLVLVDVGAGTSDVAVTKDGMVVGYGMVPLAGDEITEAISRQYLLDFNVAEQLKRKLTAGKNKKLPFRDVLGLTHKVSAVEIIAGLAATVDELAQAIAAQIVDLNGTAPQAVLLVGGGSLTPRLPEKLAQALGLPAERVAIRCPDELTGLIDLPASLQTPDAITPLGILKLAGSQQLKFVNLELNKQRLHLFNLGRLTVADALLSAGIDARRLYGKPGLGITLTLNGQTRFIPGDPGRPGRIILNGAEAELTAELQEADVVTITAGADGTTPRPTLGELIQPPAPFAVTINDRLLDIYPLLTVNDQPAVPTTELADRDQIVCRRPETLAEILTIAGLSPAPTTYKYTVNGATRVFSTRPAYTLNGSPAALTSPVAEDSLIRVITLPPPTLAEILGLHDQADDLLTVTFNGCQCSIPLRQRRFEVNGRPADLTDHIADGQAINYTTREVTQPTISDVLLAADFNPATLPPAARFDILLNDQPTEYTTPVKNGDAVSIVVRPGANRSAPPAGSASPPAG